MVRFLLQHGADVNARDVSGKTPLAIATRKGHGELIELLAGTGGRPGAYKPVQMSVS